jgi:hypothetical protein
LRKDTFDLYAFKTEALIRDAFRTDVFVKDAFNTEVFVLETFNTETLAILEIKKLVFVV